MIEEKPERAAAGKKEPEGASGAKYQGAEAGDAEDAKEEDADVSSKSSATSAVFGLDGSMAQWLKRLANGIGRRKADDADAAKKYQVRCAHEFSCEDCPGIACRTLTQCFTLQNCGGC